MEQEGPLLWLKLNRPEAANSLSSQLLMAIRDACSEIAGDKRVQVVAIVGTGTKVFSAGADLKERQSFSPGELVDYHALIQSTMLAVENLPQPVIAALNGSAYGGGVELALACDLRLIVKDAILRMTEVRLGIIPGAGGTQRLPRLIGKTRAKEMILAATPITAQQAYQYGLVNRIIEDEAKPDAAFHQTLMEEVRGWAKEISTAAPLSLKQAKRAINSGCEKDLEAGLALETKAYLALLNTKDRLEGLAA
ncbi:MAG: enoyl-CoA hydratase, partial [Candidatus Melainabacteria bacterium]